MKKQIKNIAAFIFLFTPTIAIAAELPKTNSEGDYIGKTGHPFWQVITSDPNGLSCRMGDMSIDDIVSPSSPPLNINNLPVVTNLEKNQIIEASPIPAGFVLKYDVNKKPWLFITESNCFVPANSQYVKPVNK